ncbi:hypothetical protein ACFVAJ_19135 [Agromyces sp. NPDC057679]|uniref:hypothetical protein n=1 Tax=Agromyces sp. NPDC057679 TaxID=3346207 RepID=UPI0036717F9D
MSSSFTETEHPRGQASNAGQFRDKQQSAPTVSLTAEAGQAPQRMSAGGLSLLIQWIGESLANDVDDYAGYEVEYFAGEGVGWGRVYDRQGKDIELSLDAWRVAVAMSKSMDRVTLMENYRPSRDTGSSLIYDFPA